MLTVRAWKTWRSPTRILLTYFCLSQLVSTVGSIVLGNRTPQPGSFNSYLVKSEDIAIGTVLGNISAIDTDGPSDLSFSIPDKMTTTASLVELRNLRVVDTYTRFMDIVLIAKLDRDFEPSKRKLIFSATDGQSTIALEVTLMIQDVNDEPPMLLNVPYKVTINESHPVDSVVFSNISAFDPDNGRGQTIEYSLKTDAQGANEEYRSTFEISTDSGLIYLKRKLDYEKHSFYLFKVGVKDKGEPLALTGESADLVISVLDVQDTPPMFVNLPYSTELKETETVGTSVLRVTGIDGDQGIPNNLSYSFVSGDYGNFDIDSVTGWITVKAALDRDSASMASNGGVYAMYVQATEIDGGRPNYGETTAQALVTISVQDVNDNSPVFGQSQYTASIHENMQNGVPVTFFGDRMRVSDDDQGTNSHFSLSVEKQGQPYYDFTTLPQEVYKESTVLIRVNNSQALDYETEKEIVFQVVAREIETTERRSSTATVTLNVLDMNDNAPNFTHAQYLFTVSEDAVVDFSIGEILALDDDTESYASLSYSIRGGNDKFRVDSLSGSLYVDGALDRETTSEYYLSAEATDGGGLRTPAEIRILVTDVNDNPPLFRRSDYEGVVREKDVAFLRPIIVEAVDDDAPTSYNSLVRYRIDSTPTGLENNFTIDEVTGEVSLQEPLDYEKLDPDLQGKITLQVVAHDQGTPRMNSSVNVNITVEDINDFPPVFKPNVYTKNIVENSPEGTTVLTVTANDLDATSPNNDFFYRIESGALDKFRIDFRSGDILVETGARLDREEKKEYYLRVSATDRGNSPLTGFSNVTILLDNVNDEMPRFAKPNDAVTVSENLAVGRSVFSYVAVDSDDDSQLRYSLLKDAVLAVDENGETVDAAALGVNSYFDVHASNGTVYVSSDLDRETAERIVVKILAQDTNAADPPQQSATATLTITLSDYNDNAPSFGASNEFRVNVSEAENINSVILRVMATDADRGEQVTYKLERSDNDPTGVNAFSVVESSGTVKLQQKLDRETKPSHTFIVVATDTGSPQQSSSATVFISVSDENDNMPEFIAYPTQFRVSEDALVDSVIYTMEANDLDIGLYGLVSYSLEGVDSGDGDFAIDSTTGKLTVAKPLDRETKREYRLEVVAHDSDPDPVDRKSKRASITVKVTDVNDNKPQFETVSETSPTVAEISNVGTSIFTVTATDIDEDENGTVRYSLTSETNATFGGRDLFSIEPVSGIVRVAQALQSKANYYLITVEAADQGANPKSSTKPFVINVYDVNDALPIFVKPDPENAVALVLEGEPPGTLVTRLEAVDSDTGRNGQVKYSLDPTQSQGNLQTFEVNATSGELTTLISLNREQFSEYKLEVIASDNGIPTSFSSSLTLTVRVKDVNDQPPMFDRNNLPSPYVVSFRENETSQACANVSVAIDKDIEFEFTRICYYLVGSELADTFDLKKTGSLCLQQDKMLDREVTAYINLVVRASDDCNEEGVAVSTMEPSHLNQPSLYKPEDTSLLWVNVSVNDVNDFRPVFVRDDLTLGITRDVQVGRFIFNMKDEVVDRDTAKWGVDKFVNLTDFQPHPKRLADELTDMKVTSPFILFPNGSVKVNTYFNADMSGFFIVSVRVIDMGGLTDEAFLRISLISDSERLKVVFREGVGKVGTYRVTFAQRMSEVTNYRIVVDKVQTHENENGVAETDKTDMFIHGEDKSTNTIIPAVVLLQRIDELSARMDMISLLNDFNILEIVETRVAAPADETEKKLQMALILVSVILGVLCIILIVVLYFTYKRYARKLKAATALAYVNSGVGPQEADLYKVDIPGTNMHSFENANPIYLEKVMLEGDEDGQNSLDENALRRRSPRDLDDQEVRMNIFPDSREHRNSNNINNNHRKAINIRSSYLKAVISEHETSKNLQGSVHSKKRHADKKMSSSSRVSSPTPSRNSNIDDVGVRGIRTVAESPPPFRPIVIGMDYDEQIVDDETVTFHINGMPSTEI